MADTPKTRSDFENMSDEDFLALDPEDYSGDVPEGETSLTSEEDDHAVQGSNDPEDGNQEEGNDGDDPDGSDTSADGGESGESDDGSASGSDDEGEEGSEGSENQADPMAGEGTDTSGEEDPSKGEQSEADAGEEGKTPDAETGDGKDLKGKETPAKAGYYKLPDGMDTAQVDAALGFYSKITAPFKADGRDFTVRSPEDAIRLMQQGVNYSRRMQEIKPMKQLNRMLSDQGLDDPNKLNFLIDLAKGDKGAITQLLKSHKIDPMDLDPENHSGYQANNYAGNPQSNEFREALDVAVASPEGAALVTHIHESWDDVSKRKLRENPGILGNLTEMKAAGVYDKVVEELNYQRSIGYLQGIPFLQAFDQVGEAMKNAGVFNQPQPNPSQGGSMAPLQSGQPQNQPVAQGARKQTGTKKPVANPHLSSTPPSKQTGNTTPKEPDFDKMSDEEFLKMAPPE
jgi:hypothetical protein